MNSGARRVFTGRLPGLVAGLAGFALLWWVITEGREGSWSVGLPVVLMAAAWHALARNNGPSLSPLGLVRFLPFFVWYSLKGGVDVAWRVLQPRTAIDPAVVELGFRLPPGAPRVVYVFMAGLLPGTMGVDWEGERLYIHVIDRNGGFREELQLLERRTADLFGLPLPGP